MMIQDLGELRGELLVFGGPYSNLDALKALKKVADSRRIPLSNIICTGDVVGYCAYPDECIKFIAEWGIPTIAGNVEFNLRDEADDCGCNFDEGSRCDILSKQWFPFARSQVSETSMKYLKALPEFIRFQYNKLDYFVLHGSYENTSEFIFKSTPWELKKKNFDATKSQVVLSGHSGIPFLDSADGLLWINAGVIGMPANDGTLETWYVLIDKENVEFKRLAYEYNSAYEAMQSKPLPQSYAKTLINGLWDNCDILPKLETSQQGQILDL